MRPQQSYVWIERPACFMLFRDRCAETLPAIAEVFQFLYYTQGMIFSCFYLEKSVAKNVMALVKTSVAGSSPAATCSFIVKEDFNWRNSLKATCKINFSREYHPLSHAPSRDSGCFLIEKGLAKKIIIPAQINFAGWALSLYGLDL